MRRWGRLSIVPVCGLVAALAVPSITSSAKADPAFEAHGSVNQVYATGLPAGGQATLFEADGTTAFATANADQQGGVLFREVPGTLEGTFYFLEDDATGQKLEVAVHDATHAPWDPQIYSQSIPDNGYSYLTTRDGTQLAIDVHPPTSPAGEPGLPTNVKVPNGPDYTPPYPTLIEYSGYGYADPSGPVNGIAVLANLMGFAVVDVNMRGTGCSGGAYDFFETLQNLDGYDVIETIAHQPWVLDHKVGMMGISYGAISQLFTAQLDPPDLEAISPLSTIDATATTLYPGGILNTGFAVAWAQQRQQEALPAGPNGGQAWAYKQIQSGDKTCAANQALHGEAADLMAKIKANSTYNPPVADPLDPVTFVKAIKVPTFMACQWEDEQTGGHCADLVQHFTGTDQTWFNFTNGAHIDSLDPATFNRWYDFLELFVAHRAPIFNQALIRAAAPVIYNAAMGIDQKDPITLPPDPIQLMPTLQLAKAAFEKERGVTVLFDNGAGTAPTGTQQPGDPYAGFETTFPTFPVKGVSADTWYFSPDGTMSNDPPQQAGVNWYRSNASALPLTDFGDNTGGAGLWGNASQWSWKWNQNPSGSAVSYVSAPLSGDTTVVGGGAVHLMVMSSTPDVDLQATVSEVRPDGKETFVQNGWLRASERALACSDQADPACYDDPIDQASSPFQPEPTMLSADLQPMPSGTFVPVTIPLYFEGHVYRKGSRIRITIAAPNGTQPVWSFSQTQPADPSGAPVTGDVSIQTAGSSLVLPVIPDVIVPTSLPPCPGLRNEPCRAYQPMTDQTGAPPG